MRKILIAMLAAVLLGGCRTNPPNPDRVKATNEWGIIPWEQTKGADWHE
jgi:hypothetical protein